MMRGMLGEQIFITGVRNYLKHFQFQNAYSTDLFSELTAAAANNGMTIDVTEVMYEWTAVAGYPLVSCATSTSGSDTTWTCTQARFYSYNNPNPASTKWTIHLTATTPVTATPALPVFWPSSQGSTPLKFSVPSTTPYVKLNTNNMAFMRVLYDAPSLSALSTSLNQPGFGGIHHDDRLGLVNDAMVLVNGLGLYTWPQALGLTNYLQNELSFPVWQVATPSLLDVYNRLKYSNNTAKAIYIQYMQQEMSGVGSYLNLTASASSYVKASDAILDGLLALPLVRFNVSGRVNQLLPMFEDLYSGRKQISRLQSKYDRPHL